MLILDIASLVLLALGVALSFRRDLIPARALLLAGSVGQTVAAATRGDLPWLLVDAACVALWAVLLARSVRGRRAAR